MEFTIQPLGKSFSILTNYYVGIITRNLAGIGIDRHYYVVYVLGETESPMCQKDLGEAIDMDSVSVVRIVDYLSDKGFVKRERDKNDRRYYRLALTSKAKSALKKIRSVFDEADEICLKGFSRTEKRQFHSLLWRVHQNLLAQPRNQVKLNYKKVN